MTRAAPSRVSAPVALLLLHGVCCCAAHTRTHAPNKAAERSAPTPAWGGAAGLYIIVRMDARMLVPPNYL